MPIVWQRMPDRRGDTNMNKKSLGVGVAVMLSIALLWTGKDLLERWVAPKGFYIDPHDERRVAYGRTLYVSHCAACHGAKLEGQPNWRDRRADGRLPAPPHDESGHTWHHPDTVLFDMTRNGLVAGRTAPEGYVSDMPAYQGILSDAEIIAVLAYIKSTWSKETLDLQMEVNRTTWTQ